MNDPMSIATATPAKTFATRAGFCLCAAVAVLGSASVLRGADATDATRASEQPTTAPASHQAGEPSRSGSTVPSVTGPGSPDDLRALIGVNPVGLKRVDMPHMPVMSLRGFIQVHDQKPMALVEIKELDRNFLVQVGTEIPVTVPGRVIPVGRAELTGLGGASKAPAAPAVQTGGQQEQSQIILKVTRVSSEGVTIEAGLLAQTIIIR